MSLEKRVSTKTELDSEIVRLAGLLALARDGLLTAARALRSYLPLTSDMTMDAYRRSDPSAQPESEPWHGPP